MTITAHRDTRSLTQSLANSGWGLLAGPEWPGVRTVLRALVDCLPYKAGAGQVTIGQVSDRTGGMTPRWVARCLHVLEDLDLITWHRGGVVTGQPTPSWIRINKTTLVDLIAIARPQLAEITARRRAATAARIAGLRTTYCKTRRPPRNPLSLHVELSSTLHPLKGESPTGDDPPHVYIPPAMSWRDRLAAHQHQQEA